MPKGRNGPFVVPARPPAAPFAEAAAAATAACAAEELMMTGAGATSRTGAPRPFLAPAFTTRAPVWS